MREEGTYARGSVAVRPLPPEVYGTAAERVVPLRRLEGSAVEEEDVARHVARELEKVRMPALGFCTEDDVGAHACSRVLLASPGHYHLAHHM